MEFKLTHLQKVYKTFAEFGLFNQGLDFLKKMGENPAYWTKCLVDWRKCLIHWTKHVL